MLDDLQYSGYLCHEQMPVPPPRILDLHEVFSLQQFPKPPVNVFSETLVGQRLSIYPMYVLQ